MLPYWIMFAYFGVGGLIENRRMGDRYTGRTFLALGFIFIAFMAGFRYHVGGDWGSYDLLYIATAQSSLGSALSLSDPGYQFLGWICAQTGAGIWLLNLVCAAVSP